MRLKMNNCIKIGATGHRKISQTKDLIESIHKTLQTILDNFPAERLSLISPLAEGADQIIAEIGSEYSEVSLIVPLPLPKEEYLKDFETRKGIQRFERLMNTAATIFNLPQAATHLTAYEQLGNYLVENCDLIVAIWNGEPELGKGGTGEVIQKALDNGKNVYWIYANNEKPEALNALKNQKSTGALELLEPNR
jgi:hypothetical protein